MKTRVLERPEELVRIAWSCASAFQGVPWYRGQADASWSLRPEVARPETRHGLARAPFEKRLAREFRRQAEARLAGPWRTRTWSDWLVLMQHHGLPTRLLDWSTSILVATFFAVQDPAGRGRDGVLYALDPECWNQRELGRRSLLAPEDEAGALACRLAFRSLAPPPRRTSALLLRRLERAVVALEPRETFARMLWQQSRFTVHGRDEGLEETPAAGRVLRRYLVPAARKVCFARTLELFGFRLSTLFPDLDHLAQDLRRPELRWQVGRGGRRRRA